MKTVTPPVRHKGNTHAAKKILTALYDLEDTLQKGIPLAKKYTVRHVIPPPKAYTGKQVKALRSKLGLSQTVFAKLIGASAVLVQKWESNERHPDGMARRLMDDMDRDPHRWLALIGEPAQLSA